MREWTLKSEPKTRTNFCPKRSTSSWPPSHSEWVSTSRTCDSSSTMTFHAVSKATTRKQDAQDGTEKKASASHTIATTTSASWINFCRASQYQNKKSAASSSWKPSPTPNQENVDENCCSHTSGKTIRNAIAVRATTA